MASLMKPFWINFCTCSFSALYLFWMRALLFLLWRIAIGLIFMWWQLTLESMLTISSCHHAKTSRFLCSESFLIFMEVAWGLGSITWASSLSIIKTSLRTSTIFTFSWSESCPLGTSYISCPLSPHWHLWARHFLLNSTSTPLLLCDCGYPNKWKLSYIRNW